MFDNFAKLALAHGGDIRPLIIPAAETNGTGLMNPSILNDNGVLRCIVRHVNYTFYHSEKKTFQHQYGPLTYIHPENDMHLRTWNWYVELDSNLNITRYSKIDTSKFDTYEPQWDFVGLEDARIVRWDGDLWITGVRRDTTTNGEGRMEMSKIDVQANAVVETERYRIQPPNNPNSYCEKNWMPILHMPNHYIKWSNPTEVVEVNRTQGTSKTISLSNQISLPNDLRGGSQVIPWGDYFIALTHEVNLFNSEVGRKDGLYMHRFVLWDKNWNIVRHSKEFLIMNGHVEFSIGMCHLDSENMAITFGFQDNAAYILKTPKKAIVEFING